MAGVSQEEITGGDALESGKHTVTSINQSDSCLFSTLRDGNDESGLLPDRFEKSERFTFNHRSGYLEDFLQPGIIDKICPVLFKFTQ